ncbi:hypothetical protein CVN56_26085 [Rhodococcus sp. AQ5-07]|nr:hypothetical protein CVN56_26085 [Rhodococcus sp. AQ5-07]
MYVNQPRNRLRFAVVDKGVAPPLLPFPNVVLTADLWDDFKFKTLFSVTLWMSKTEVVELGGVKILEYGQASGRPNVPMVFDELPEDFCSLGQDIEYYENLNNLPKEIRQNYLHALRDVVQNPAIEEKFEGQFGWNTSLLRFGEAANALNAGRKLLSGNALSPDKLSFEFDWANTDYVTQVPFRFNDSGQLPGRCHVLIGYNGVGKTTMLADLALAASSGGRKRAGSKSRSKISGNDTTFGAVVSISYSPFDTFLLPEFGQETEFGSQTAEFGYTYCGLRRRSTKMSGKADLGNKKFELKSIDEIEFEFAEALDTAVERGSGGHLRDAFDALGREPSFGRAGIDLAALRLSGKSMVDAFSRLSTGHKIVLNIVTQLAAHLRTRSLVLIDEPETHLHPPLVAALLRSIQLLLNAHSSFAVIATHSPVVVQEMPSKCVRILERFGDQVGLREPQIETFAENIGLITRHVFSLDSSSTDHQGILADLSKAYSDKQINEMFPRGLSFQGNAFVANYRELL